MITFGWYDGMRGNKDQEKGDGRDRAESKKGTSRNHIVVVCCDRIGIVQPGIFCAEDSGGWIMARRY